MLKLLPVNTVNPATNLLILDRSWQVLQAEERRTQPLKTQNKSRRKGRARTVWIDNSDKRMTSRMTKNHEQIDYAPFRDKHVGTVQAECPL